MSNLNQGGGPIEEQHRNQQGARIDGDRQVPGTQTVTTAGNQDDQGGNKNPQQAGNPEAGAAKLSQLLAESLKPLADQLKSQGDLTTQAFEKILQTKSAGATVLSPVTDNGAIAAVSAAAALLKEKEKKKAKKDKKKRKKDSDSDSGSGNDSDSADSLEELRLAFNTNEAKEPSDPLGFRLQAFQGFELAARAAITCLSSGDPDGASKAIRWLQALVRRAETGVVVTEMLASEPRVGLTAADVCFSKVCNKLEFQKSSFKAKDRVSTLKDYAIRKASDGKHKGAGGSGSGGGAKDEGKERRDNRENRDSRDYQRRYDRPGRR